MFSIIFQDALVQCARVLVRYRIGAATVRERFPRGAIIIFILLPAYPSSTSPGHTSSSAAPRRTLAIPPPNASGHAPPGGAHKHSRPPTLAGGPTVTARIAS